jgi:hypothetical protein
MSMTRKDFELIAAAIRDATADALRAYGSSGKAGAEKVARLMATTLKQTNPRFDKERFLAACDINEPA